MRCDRLFRLRRASLSFTLLAWTLACASPREFAPVADASADRDATPVPADPAPADAPGDQAPTPEAAGSIDGADAGDGPGPLAMPPGGPCLQCSGRCVDAMTNADNCGECGRVCAGRCASGACLCVMPNPSNLVTNGGFDRDAGDWLLFPGSQPVRSPAFDDDASSCADSRSLALSAAPPERQASVSQCLGNIPAGSYGFGGWIRIKQGSARGIAAIHLDSFAGNGCEGELVNTRTYGFNADDPPTGWRHHGWTPLLLPFQNTRSARLRLSVQLQDAIVAGTFSANFDMLYVTPGEGGWN